MLVHRLRRWTNVYPTLIQRLVSAGIETPNNSQARPIYDQIISVWLTSEKAEIRHLLMFKVGNMLGMTLKLPSGCALDSLTLHLRLIAWRCAKGGRIMYPAQNDAAIWATFKRIWLPLMRTSGVTQRRWHRHWRRISTHLDVYWLNVRKRYTGTDNTHRA